MKRGQRASGTASHVALLRAVNVGGTGKLVMSDLVAMAEELGYRQPRTYIASGNLIFECSRSESEVKAELEAALLRHMGKPVGVLVRTGPELEAILAANPFPDRAPNRTTVIFLDEPPAPDTLARVVAPDGEEVRLGVREIYVHYGASMARSKLRIPGASDGTARNINTVGRLAQLANEG